MKVLHIIAAYKPALIYGGPTMSAAMLCEELVKAGVTVEVYATTANGTEELPVNVSTPQQVDGVRVTYFKRITKDHTHFSPALLKQLWHTLKNFDAVHIHAWWNLVSVLSAAIAIARGVPVLISPRGTLSPYTFTNKNSAIKNLIHKIIGSVSLNKSHIHTTSLHESKAILTLINPKSITTIPNFVKLNNVGTRQNSGFSNSIKLLFLSRIEEKKGLDILLNALKLMTTPYHLTIAGTGNPAYIDQLKELSKDIAANITWAGFYGEEKFARMQEHDLLVLPSHDENFGNVVIESLSTGTGVLISSQVGLADYVKKNNLGWVCDTTAKSVSDAITDISINRKQDLDRIREIAPDLVRIDFTGKALIDQYISLYSQIMSK